MPKTKEQKQKEALARQSVSFYRQDLASLIRLLPGGSSFHSRTFKGEDAKRLVDLYEKIEKEAEKYQVKLPRTNPDSFRCGYTSASTRLLENLTTVWVGQLLDMYEKALGEEGASKVVELFNDAGKARERSDFQPMIDEVRVARGVIKDIFVKKMNPRKFAKKAA